MCESDARWALYTPLAVALTPALIAWTVLIDAVAGVRFDWLYWRHSLEAAMASHPSFHCCCSRSHCSDGTAVSGVEDGVELTATVPRALGVASQLAERFSADENGNLY
jgi:hypothetical protein